LFSKYKKTGGQGGAPGTPELKRDLPVVKETAPVAAPQENQVKRRQMSRTPTQASPVDKEKKRKERLGEIKLELHKRLLDNLNLGALDPVRHSTKWASFSIAKNAIRLIRTSMTK
jgi:pilus assembly protein CpaF